MRRTIEIRTDDSISNEEKEQRLREIDEDFKKRAEEMDSLYSEYFGARDKAEKEYRSAFEPDYEYRKIEGTHRVEDDASKEVINPDGTMMNCQRCAVAFELRRRGYDVMASDGEADGLGMPSEIMRCFVGSEQESFSSTDSDEITTGVRDKMLSWGDGSRALVCATFDGYAHAFNMCVSGEEVSVIDSQIGATWSDKTSLESGGRVNLGLDGAKNVLLIRTDKAKLGIDTERYVKEVR